MEEQDLICINCPRGCSLYVVKRQEQFEVSGQFCSRGEEYAKQELINPTRVLTVLMRVEGADRPISVKTDRPVPKSMLRACAQEIYRTHPKAPVCHGQVVIENILGTGSNVVATGDTQENLKEIR